jgi:DNA-binding NtrC family response regulator
MIRDTLVRSSTDVLALNAFEVRFEHTSVPSPVRSYEQALDHVPTEEAPAHGSTLETETKRTSLKESERRLIMEAVRSANGNKTRAAAMLGISRQALCNRLRRMRSGK